MFVLAAGGSRADNLKYNSESPDPKKSFKKPGPLYNPSDQNELIDLSLLYSE